MLWHLDVHNLIYFELSNNVKALFPIFHMFGAIFCLRNVCHIVKYRLDWICDTWTGLVKHGFVKGEFVKHGSVKHGFVKRGFVKHEFLKGGFVKHGFIKICRPLHKHPDIFKHI